MEDHVQFEEDSFVVNEEWFADVLSRLTLLEENTLLILSVLGVESSPKEVTDEPYGTTHGSCSTTKQLEP